MVLDLVMHGPTIRLAELDRRADALTRRHAADPVLPAKGDRRLAVAAAAPERLLGSRGLGHFGRSSGARSITPICSLFARVKWPGLCCPHHARSEGLWGCGVLAGCFSSSLGW